MNALTTKVKNKKGFTLIELIVVIVIIGILAAIAIPKLSGFSDNAKYKSDVATAKTIATAAMTQYAEDGTEAASVAVLKGKYLDNVDYKSQYISGADFDLDWGTDGLEISIGSDTNKKTLYPVADELD